MKRLISIALIMAMCLCLFAGCNDNTPADNTDGLASAKTYLFNVYNTAGKGEENKIVSDKDLTTVVLVGDNSYTVEWKVEITSGDAGSVILTESDKESNVLLKLVDRTNDIHFTLTATIKDSEGNSETLSLNCFTPLVEKIELSDGKVFLYSPNDSKFITSEMYVYTSSSGSTKNELVLTAESASAVQLTVRSNDDGSVTFVTDDGLYLFTDGTNTYFVDAESEEGYTNFILEAVSGGMLIKSQTAVYSGNAQYLEVYSGYLTCYSYQEAKAYLYTFQLIDAECEHTETVAVEAVAPTCTETGTTAGTKCTSCGLIMGVEVVDALGHTWGEWEVTTEATEAADGEKQRTCSVCGTIDTITYSLEKALPDGNYTIFAGETAIGALAEEKNYGYLPAAEVATAWTITNVDGGVTIQDCYGRYIYMSGTYNSFNLTTEPTDGHIFSVTKNAVGAYTFVNVLTGKTLAYSATFTSCGAYADVSGEDYTSCFTLDEQALLPDGEYTINAGEIIIGALGEDKTYGYLPVAETATIWKITNVDGGITIQDCYGRYIYMKGDYNSFNLTTEPTEGHIFSVTKNADGTYTLVNVLMGKTLAYSATYTSCGAYADVSGEDYTSCFTVAAYVPDEGGECEHANTEDVEAVAPTCTEEGSTPGKKCTDCGAVIGVETVAALGHTWGEWETVKEPTETEDGEKKRVCSVCNTEETEPIQLVPTEWVAVDTPEVETAYKLGLVQGNLDNVTLYFAGTTANTAYYMTTTENVKEAVDVYVESVDGGYRLYFYVDETKTYLDIYYTDTGYVNLRLTTEPTAVFTWNTEYNTFVAYISDAETSYYIGTYSTFKTLSASKLDYASTSFTTDLYVEQEVQEIEEEPAQKKNYVTDDGNVGLAVYDGYVDYFNFEKNVVEHGLAVTEENNTYSFVYARGSATVSFTLNEDGTVSLVDSNLGSFTLSEGEINGELGGESGEEGGETGGEAVGVPGTFTEAQQGTYSGRISAFGEFTLVIDDASAMLNLPSYEFEGFKGELTENDGRYVMMISEDENMTLIFTFDGDTISGEMTWFEDEPYVFTATKQVDAGVTLVLADHAEANGWANETRHNEVQVDENITVTMSPADAQYTGNFYTKNNSWRLYQTDSGKLTITAAEGKTIVSVKITFTGKYTSDYLTDGTSEYASEALITVNASTLTLSVGTHEAGKTNGQAQITTIEIVYE